MSRLTRKRLLLAKIESSYGVDPTPTEAANAMLTSGLEPTPLAGDSVRREIDREKLGGIGSIRTNPFVQFAFGVEVGGGGAVDTPPPYGPLLRASGLAETINASTSVVYNPISTGFESVTMYGFFDGNRHIGLGGRGTFSMRLAAREIPRWNFTMSALRVAPTSVSASAADQSAFQVPVPVTNTNTPTATFDGENLTLVACELTMNNAVNVFNLPGDNSVQITDRPQVTGRLVFHEPLISTKDWHAFALSNATGALQVVHGTVAGNIVTLDAPKVSIQNIGIGDDNGIRTLECDIEYQLNSGDDDFTLTFT